METDSVPISVLVDFALRGGAAAIGLLIAGLLLLIRPLRPAPFFGALFALGASVYAIVMTGPVSAALGAAKVPLELFAILSPAFFWLFINALFDEEFRWKHWMAGPPVILGLLHLAYLAYLPGSRGFKLLHIAVVVALMVHVIVLMRRSLGDDLVASRRQFTAIAVVLVPTVCLTIVVIAIYGLFDLHGPMTSPAIAAMLFVVANALGFGIAGIRRSLLPVPARPARRPGANVSTADRFELARLEKLMAEGVYLNSGLTIGELATLMDIPEHRLRRLINKGLGYRNFAAFINDHRIEEAKRRLARPETARDQITSLAFDLGYSSLAPFNRAFRERIGMSPSQFREKALQQA
ncbi:MAG: helix-turn-helix domain-containing protein [Oricola sp.]